MLRRLYLNSSYFIAMEQQVTLIVDKKMRIILLAFKVTFPAYLLFNLEAVPFLSFIHLKFIIVPCKSVFRSALFSMTLKIRVIAIVFK